MGQELLKLLESARSGQLMADFSMKKYFSMEHYRTGNIEIIKLPCVRYLYERVCVCVGGAWKSWHLFKLIHCEYRGGDKKKKEESPSRLRADAFQFAFDMLV
jgi:hypothetical protein